MRLEPMVVGRRVIVADAIGVETLRDRGNARLGRSVLPRGSAWSSGTRLGLPERVHGDKAQGASEPCRFPQHAIPHIYGLFSRRNIPPPAREFNVDSR